FAEAVAGASVATRPPKEMLVATRKALNLFVMESSWSAEIAGTKRQKKVADCESPLGKSGGTTQLISVTSQVYNHLIKSNLITSRGRHELASRGHGRYRFPQTVP